MFANLRTAIQTVHPLIDAVLLATTERRRHSSTDRQLRNEKAKLIKSHFRGSDAEDESFFFVFDVPHHISGFPVWFA